MKPIFKDFKVADGMAIEGQSFRTVSFVMMSILVQKTDICRLSISFPVMQKSEPLYVGMHIQTAAQGCITHTHTHTHTHTQTKYNIQSLGSNSSRLTWKYQVAANIAVKGTYAFLGYTGCIFAEKSYTCAYLGKQ